MEKQCPCKRTSCERHGDCAACEAHHRDYKRQPHTACERQAHREERRRQRARGASAVLNGEKH